MAVRDQWRVLIVKTLTGEVVADAVPRDMPSFSRKLNEKGSFTVNFELGIRANSSTDFREYSQVGKYCWVILYGDYAVQGGPAWTYQYTDSTRTLSLTGTGIQGFFDKRVLRNPTGHTAIVDPSEDLTYKNVTLREIMRRITRDNLLQTNYELPITLPLEDAASTHEMTYYGYDLATAWHRMDDLTDRIDGPEFDFVPVLSPNGLSVSWRMDIGGPKLGDQETLAVWDYGGALSVVDLDVNGSASPCARVWVRGEGTERALKTGFAEDTSLYALGFPPTDYVDGDHSSASEQATLEGYADKALEQFRYPTESWRCSVRIDGRDERSGVELSPALGSWSLGDAPTFYVDNHLWIPTGGYRKRITGFSQGADEYHVDLDTSEDKSSTSI